MRLTWIMAAAGLFVVAPVCAEPSNHTRAIALYFQAIGEGATLDDALLGAVRGGADWQSNDIFATGQMAANEASHLTTGSNFVAGGSFGNSSGFPTVVQNSGNNVLIQNSTIINLQLQ